VQHTAADCNTLQQTATYTDQIPDHGYQRVDTATHCITLQHTLQHTATHLQIPDHGYERVDIRRRSESRQLHNARDVSLQQRLVVALELALLLGRQDRDTWRRQLTPISVKRVEYVKRHLLLSRRLLLARCRAAVNGDQNILFFQILITTLRGPAPKASPLDLLVTRGGGGGKEALFGGFKGGFQVLFAERKKQIAVDGMHAKGSAIQR